MLLPVPLPQVADWAFKGLPTTVAEFWRAEEVAEMALLHFLWSFSWGALQSVDKLRVRWTGAGGGGCWQTRKHGTGAGRPGSTGRVLADPEAPPLVAHGVLRVRAGAGRDEKHCFERSGHRFIPASSNHPDSPGVRLPLPPATCCCLLPPASFRSPLLSKSQPATCHCHMPLTGCPYACRVVHGQRSSSWRSAGMPR